MSATLYGSMSGEFMFEMAWKSALIAGVALLLVLSLRSRAPADRSAVLRVAIALLLALPLFSLILPRLEVEAWTPAPIEVPADLLAAAAAAPAASEAAPELAAAVGPTIWDDPTILFLLLYLGGVAMAAGRLGAGLWTLRRWTRDARPVDCPVWTEAFGRVREAAGAPARLRLLLAEEVPSPLSWGLFQPVILIDPDSIDHEEDAEAILAHELAHVVRRDWAVLMLARIAVGLFWFNPLVRLLERELVQQAEEAADIEAARRIEPARYAQTLVHWAQFAAAGSIPAHAIAPGARALTRRVRAILDARQRAIPAGSGWALAAMGGCSSFALAVAVLQPIAAAAEIRPVAAIAPPAPLAALAPLAAPPATARAPLAPLAPLTPTAPFAPAALAALAAVPGAPAAALPPVPPAPPKHGPVGPHGRIGPHGRVGPTHLVIPAVDAAEIERQVAAAMASVDVGRIAAEAAAIAIHDSVAISAAGMERGAAALQENARQMNQQAHQFASSAYRERRIAEAARRGHRLSHEQLIELGNELRDGAREMTDGAREMRQAAAEMRREARH
jgi:beta-lactamase regulating signal transducer with metallopeptidase domain